MRHFSHLPPAAQDDLFRRAPRPFGRWTAPDALGRALGAVLYTPATRPTVAADLVAGRHPGLAATVLCLEDAIDDRELEAAEAQCLGTLGALSGALRRGDADPETLPLLFVRVRSPEHLERLSPRLAEHHDALTGYVLPKFGAGTAPRYLELLAGLDADHEAPVYGMPILETPELIYRESRDAELDTLAWVLDAHRERVLAVRLGGTDFCGLFGLRRSPELTIYDIGVVRDCIAAVVNVLCRRERAHVVAAPVWEYFSSDQRILKPLLRESPFEEEGGTGLRRGMLDRAEDGLVRELLLDEANGLLGKTVIHPSHVGIVHALGAVTSEAYDDACSILEAGATGGAMGSRSGNKMNEARPHQVWAQRMLARADAFGVLREHHSWLGLLEASRATAAVAG